MTGVLAFLEPGLVAVGDLASVKRAIDAQLSAHSITSNNEMMELVERHRAVATTRGPSAASTPSPARRSCPTRSRSKIPPVKWFAVAGHINGGVSAQLRAEASDDQAAENLRGVLNGVLPSPGCRVRTTRSSPRSSIRCSSPAAARPSGSRSRCRPRSSS